MLKKLNRKSMQVHPQQSSFTFICFIYWGFKKIFHLIKSSVIQKEKNIGLVQLLGSCTNFFFLS